MTRNHVFWLSLVAALCAVQAQAKGPVYRELAARSYPSDVTAVSLFNPWGERLVALDPLPATFGPRIATAAKVYEAQRIRFDGYLGSNDDGSHYETAADGEDAAYYGSTEKQKYLVAKDGIVDDTRERVWVCLDYPVHAVVLAGFPLRQAMAADFKEASAEYTFGGTFAINAATSSWFYRRVRNLLLYLKRKQQYWEEKITQAQYRDEDFRPGEPFKIGDIVFMGHYGDVDERSVWAAKHSAIVGSVDKRGLPVLLFNMRVSHKMRDNYDGIINQTRTIDGEQVYFRRFSDRYSLTGHARIVKPFPPPRSATGGVVLGRPAP